MRHRFLAFHRPRRAGRHRFLEGVTDVLTESFAPSAHPPAGQQPVALARFEGSLDSDLTKLNEIQKNPLGSRDISTQI